MRMDFGANHWITAVLLAKRDRWLLWLPVFYGAGIGGTGFAFGAAEKINAGGGEGAANGGLSLRQRWQRLPTIIDTYPRRRRGGTDHR